MIKDIKITLYINYNMRLKYNLYIFIIDDPSSKDNSENEIQKEEEDSSEEQDIENEWKINPKDRKYFGIKNYYINIYTYLNYAQNVKKICFVLMNKNLQIY